MVASSNWYFTFVLFAINTIVEIKCASENVKRTAYLHFSYNHIVCVHFICPIKKRDLRTQTTGWWTSSLVLILKSQCLEIIDFKSSHEAVRKY